MDDVAAPSPSGNPGFVAPSPKETPRFDPYAFPADDHVSQSGNVSSYHSSAPLQLSVHPKTYLPPGNPSSLVKNSHEKCLEPYPNQFSTCLHSPTQGAHPAAQSGQQFIHPSSKLENDSGNMSTDSVHLLKPTQFQQFTSERQVSQCENGVLSQQADWKSGKPKKKKKPKAAEVGGAEVVKRVKKPPKAKELTTSTPIPQVLSSEDSLTVGDGFSVASKAPSDLTREPKVLCAKNAAPILPVSTAFRDSMGFLHSVQAPGSFTTTPSLPPTTTTATTFTNSIRFFLDDRRHSVDSLELPTSRPASRTSTISSSSSNAEGKTKESSESVSMSKILEIIEREKSLGSSSPCKRRRTAKPQHIQEAEEEAKKYAAANAVQGMISAGSQAENPKPKNQEGAKKLEQTNCTKGGRNGAAVLPQGTSGESSRVGSSVSSPNASTLKLSQLSNDSSDSQPKQTLLPFSEEVAGGVVCGSRTPVISKSTSHPMQPETKPSPTSGRAATSSYVHSDISKLPGSSSANSQSSTGQNSHNPFQSPMQTDQSVFHQPQNRSDPQILSRSAKVNGNFIKSSLQENTQIITPHLQHGTGMPDTSTLQSVPTASTATKINLQSFDQTVLEEKILNNLSSAGAPMSLSAAAQSHLSNLQSTIQSLFHGSPSSSATVQVASGSCGEHLPSIGPALSSPDSLMDVKVQDLEPSLTCDLNNSWSQTADMISGNDSLLPQYPSNATTPTSTLKDSLLPQYPSSATTPTSTLKDSLLPQYPSSATTPTPTPKKPKKKRSPNKPKNVQSHSPSGYSVSVGVSSSGTLPPFGAFAGLKMNMTHPSYQLTPSGVHPQQPHAQANSTLSSTGTKCPVNKKKAKKSRSQTQSADEGTDRKLTKGSATLQEPLRECNSNLKPVGSGDKNELLATGGNCKTVKPATNTNAHIFKTGIHSVSSVTSTRPVTDNSGALSSEKGDPDVKQCIDHHSDFKPGSNGVIQQRTVAGSTVVSNKLENVCGSSIKPATLPGKNDVKTGLNGISLSAAMEGTIRTTVKASAVMDGLNQKVPVDGVGKTTTKAVVDDIKTTVRPPAVVDAISRTLVRTPALMDGNSKIPGRAPTVMDGHSGTPVRTPTVMDGLSGTPVRTPTVMDGLSGTPVRTPAVMDGLSGTPVRTPTVVDGLSGTPVRTPTVVDGISKTPVGDPTVMDGISKRSIRAPGVMDGTSKILVGYPPMVDGISKTPVRAPTMMDGVCKIPVGDPTVVVGVSKMPVRSSAAMDGFDRKQSMDAFLMKQDCMDASDMKPLDAAASVSGIEPVGGIGSKAKSSSGFMLNGALPGMSSTFSHMGSQTTKTPPSPIPKQEPGFLHRSPKEELDDRLRNNRVESAPKCNCLGPNYEFNENIEGPFYTQLGAARDVPGLRHIMEERTGLSGKAIRIEKVHYTGKEGRSSEGCPIAKWIIRRSGPDEKYLCVARKRPGHFCDTAYIVMVIVAWEGVASQQADSLYGYLVSTLTKNGFETERRCGTNERKTCACQGVDLIRRGASFSFGCSWSMYFNGCKFARSHIARKFKLKDTSEEAKIEEHLQDLATKVGPLYKVLAPDAYHNQTYFEEQASMCRLGNEKGRPFSGVTACIDFCAHSHKDFHNMQNGSTVVVTLTKHRGWSKPEDEQLHVLPLYIMDNTDEHGSVDGQMKKVQAGALEILHKYPVQARMRATPLKKPKRGAKKESPAKNSAGVNSAPGSPCSSTSAPGTPTSTAPVTPTKERDMSFLYSQDSSQSLSDGSLSGNSSSAMHTPEKRSDGSHFSFVDKEHSSASDDSMSQSFGPSEMYEKVWEYFYTNGAFPPPSYMDKWAAAQKQAMMNPQTAVTNNGATNEGSIEKNTDQPSPHQNPLQAADVSQNHSSPSAQHQHGTSYQPPTPGVKTEAAYSSDVDQEVVSLTHRPDHSHLSGSPSLSRQACGDGGEGNGGRLSGGHVSSRPQSVNAGDGRTTNSRHASPLDLLKEAAASMEAGLMGGMSSSSVPFCPPQFASTPASAHSRPPSQSSSLSSSRPPSAGECNPGPDLMSPNLPCPHSSPGVHNNHSHPGSPFVSPKPNCDGTSAPPSCNDNQPKPSTQSKPVMQPNGSFVAPTLGQGPDEPTFTMMDPTVVRCEWQDNTESFHDPGIGGVAIALSHGAVLFEVAKRELHATTALKNPNRYQPTRISLVFYQHKNLNYQHHGYYEYERKLTTQRKNRIKKLMEEGATAEEAEKAVKPGRKRKKGTEEEEEEEEKKIDFAKTSAAQYRYMWDTTVGHGMTLTTDSIITRWIDPQPMVTGPYQRWV